MSATLSETFSDRVKRAALGRWKLETWTKMLGVRGLERAQKMSERNQEAENRKVRQQLWGNDGGSGEGDEMGGNTYLGDVTTPAPIVVASGSSGNNLGPLLAAALGMLGPLGGVVGYFANQALTQRPQSAIVQPPAQQTTTINQEDLTVRLLRPEDLKR